MMNSDGPRSLSLYDTHVILTAVGDDGVCTGK